MEPVGQNNPQSSAPAQGSEQQQSQRRAKWSPPGQQQQQQQQQQHQQGDIGNSSNANNNNNNQEFQRQAELIKSDGSDGGGNDNNNSNNNNNSGGGGGSSFQANMNGTGSGAAAGTNDEAQGVCENDNYNNNNNNNDSGGNSTSGSADANAGQRASRRPRKAGLSQELRERVKSLYQTKTVNLMVRYNKLGSQFAEFSNNVAFLSRCANMMVIPKSHRVYNNYVRNTRVVVRLLDQCSYRIMIADLEHNRWRKYQVAKNRQRAESRLKEIMSAEDFEEIRRICDENRELRFIEFRERQQKEYQDLLDEYKQHETKNNRRRQGSPRTDTESLSSPGPGEHGDRGLQRAQRRNSHRQQQSQRHQQDRPQQQQENSSNNNNDYDGGEDDHGRPPASGNMKSNAGVGDGGARSSRGDPPARRYRQQQQQQRREHPAPRGGPSGRHPLPVPNRRTAGGGGGGGTASAGAASTSGQQHDAAGGSKDRPFAATDAELSAGSASVKPKIAASEMSAGRAK